MPQFKISLPLLDLSAERLGFYRQVGVEAVAIPPRYGLDPVVRPLAPLVPPAQTGPAGALPPAWEGDQLERICQRVRDFDLEPTSMALPVSGPILLGLDGRDRDIERLQRDIRTAGEAGIGVLTYGFTALRASAGYAALAGQGRGGADLRCFDEDRIAKLGPLPQVGIQSREQMWERLVYFLERVVPTAAAAGVRLAVHPNDPPVAQFRGVAQPLDSLAAMQRLIEIVDNRANSIFFDTGVTTEWGEDAVAAIHYFGSRDRIGAVHFRNVAVEIPSSRYTETFVDEGDCDMFACVQALAEVGYGGGLDPDHSPGIAGDGPDARLGWTYAIGHLRAWRYGVASLSQGKKV